MFHRRQLLPRPQRVHLGCGRGTQSIYPYGTAAQLVALYRLIDRVGADYDRLGWMVWIEGFPVGDRYWRKPLEDASDTLTEVIRRFADFDDDAQHPVMSDEAIDAFEAAPSKRARSSIEGVIRRRLHHSGFQTVLRLIFEVVIGIFTPSYAQLDRDDGDNQKFILGRLLGIFAAKHKRQSDSPSWFSFHTDEFENILEVMAKLLAESRNQRISSVFSGREIVDARNEFIMLLASICRMETVERQIYGRSNPVFGLLALIVRDSSVSRQAFMLLIWMIVRRSPPIGDGARQFLLEMYGPSVSDMPQVGF
jgi:hypothetical protein